MENLITAYPAAELLYKKLLSIRTAGNKNRGKERLELMTPLLNAIVGSPRNWTEFQCAKCFKGLLKEYVEPDKLELLLASSGCIEKYAKLSSATKRRTAYEKDQKGPADAQDAKTLERSENTALKQMAVHMFEDARTNPNKLISIISGMLTLQELQALELDALVRSIDGAKYEIIADTYKLKRTEKIYSIGLHSNSLFVGRTAALNALHAAFTTGYFTQIIGSEQIKGKTFLALSYARLHAEEYQTICWLNAWNEDCILSSIVSFFNIAGIDVNNLPTDKLKELFLDFFRVNTQKWLIIFDNANMTVSAQKEILESYMPACNSNGHIIITTNMFKGLRDYKFHCLDNIVNPDDGILFLKKALKLASLDDTTTQIASSCGKDLYPLRLFAAYMRESEQMNTEAYLRLLSNYGCCFEDPNSGPFLFAAFDIMMHNVQIEKKCSKSSVLYEALEQMLIACPIFMYCSVDLHFFNSEFPILPESLASVCADAEMRRQLISKLKDFGICEIDDDVLLLNDWICALSTSYFDKILINDLCLKLLDAMNMAVCDIQKENGNEAILIRAKPYADRICPLASQMVSIFELKNKYSAVWNLSYCRDWFPSAQ